MALTISTLYGLITLCQLQQTFLATEIEWSGHFQEAISWSRVMDVCQFSCFTSQKFVLVVVLLHSLWQPECSCWKYKKVHVCENSTMTLVGTMHYALHEADAWWALMHAYIPTPTCTCTHPHITLHTHTHTHTKKQKHTNTHKHTSRALFAQIQHKHTST